MKIVNKRAMVTAEALIFWQAMTKKMKTRLNRRTKKTAPFSIMRYKNRKTSPFIEDFM